jgi:aminoglycoside phosphotransferase (APT) family kinase protein
VTSQAGTRRSRLLQILQEEYGQQRITGLQPLGEGMDAKVYSAHSPHLGKLAIKVPHARWMTSGNEPRLDTRTLLRQELQLSPHLRASGLPVPEAFFMHEDDGGVDFLVTQFIESDRSELPATRFGTLIRAIHELPPPPFRLAANDTSPRTDDVLAERIQRRLKALATLTRPGPGTGTGTGTPDVTAALAASPRPTPDNHLLHMDLRPENILVQRGCPVAILDWSNALAGDPALDLARAAEYGSLTPDALTAYGNPETFSLAPGTPRDLVYRLDTAVMLAHVFLNGAPDQARAQHYIHRTTTLCHDLRTVIP